jgi:hypothetical protein
VESKTLKVRMGFQRLEQLAPTRADQVLGLEYQPVDLIPIRCEFRRDAQDFQRTIDHHGGHAIQQSVVRLGADGGMLEAGESLVAQAEGFCTRHQEVVVVHQHWMALGGHHHVAVLEIPMHETAAFHVGQKGPERIPERLQSAALARMALDPLQEIIAFLPLHENDRDSLGTHTHAGIKEFQGEQASSKVSRDLTPEEVRVGPVPLLDLGDRLCEASQGHGLGGAVQLEDDSEIPAP